MVQTDRHTEVHVTSVTQPASGVIFYCLRPKMDPVKGRLGLIMTLQMVSSQEREAEGLMFIGKRRLDFKETLHKHTKVFVS